MLPTISLGGWTVSTYHVLYVLAVLGGGLWSFDRMFRAGYRPDWILQGMAVTLAGGITGSVGLYSLVGLVAGLESGKGATLARQGSTILGALALGLLVGWAYCRFRGVPAGRVLDLAALPAPAAQAVGRLGCLASGCCGGRPTDSWLGMVLPDHAGVWCSRYPTQLMAAAADLAILAVLLVLERRFGRRTAAAPPDPNDGLLALAFLGLFLTKRTLLGFLRLEPLLLVGAFSWAQVASLAGLAVVAGVAARRLQARQP
jgi:phosphatidylglycerol---prolipoprotein diacylglyceryl transferase